MKTSSDSSVGRLSLEPALFPVSLRYHSVPIERLAGVTTRRLAEAGLPGYTASAWFGLFLPAGTSKAAHSSR